MNGFEYYVSCFKNCADFSGRARRREFWYFFLFQFFILVSLKSLGFGVETAKVFLIFTILPTISVTVRRLHDTNRSSFYFIFNFIPYLGFLILLIFLILDGDEGINDYGLDPKAPSLVEEEEFLLDHFIENLNDEEYV